MVDFEHYYEAKPEELVKPRVIVTITARMKSTRLPLKVMRYIEGKPMIEHQIDRLKSVNYADDIVLCTSYDPQDAILVDVAEKCGIKYFIGSKEDVLDRLYSAAMKFGADFIVSVTADNPLVDPEHIDKMILEFRKSGADYITCKGLPFGAFAYGVKVSVLRRVIDTKKEIDTEVWGKFFESMADIKKVNIMVPIDLHHPEVRLTVDTEEDLELVRNIFHTFYKGDLTLKNAISYSLGLKNE